MLAADKADLRTSLAVNVLQIREKEMQCVLTHAPAT